MRRVGFASARTCEVLESQGRVFPVHKTLKEWSVIASRLYFVLFEIGHKKENQKSSVNFVVCRSKKFEIAQSYTLPLNSAHANRLTNARRT